MKSQFMSKKSRDFIKVKYESEGKTQNKIICCKNLRYSQFVEKLIVSLDIPKLKCFKLFCYDHNQNPITINQQEDYEKFTKNIEQTVLYLHETKDQNSDFRKHVRIMTLEEYQVEKQKLNEKLEELQKLKHNFDQNKAKEIDSLINEKSQILRKELQDFKKTLQNRRDRALADKFEQMYKKMGSNRNNSKWSFKHSLACQSQLECEYKIQIIGIRYKCVICLINLCQKCAEEKFKCKNCIHDPTHPSIKVRNNKWDGKLSKLAAKLVKLSPQKRQNSRQQKIITDLANLKNWKYEQAREFRNKYPQLSYQQLADRSFE